MDLCPGVLYKVPCHDFISSPAQFRHEHKSRFIKKKEANQPNIHRQHAACHKPKCSDSKQKVRQLHTKLPNTKLTFNHTHHICWSVIGSVNKHNPIIIQFILLDLLKINTITIQIILLSIGSVNKNNPLAIQITL